MIASHVENFKLDYCSIAIADYFRANPVMCSLVSHKNHGGLLDLPLRRKDIQEGRPEQDLNLVHEYAIGFIYRL